MAYRPQYAYEPPPPGWEDVEFEYYFDSLNTPGLAQLPCYQVPLTLQPDAEFHLRGIEIANNPANAVIRIWKGNTQLAHVPVPIDLVYSSFLQSAPPVGKAVIPLEPEVPCEAGSQLMVDMALTTGIAFQSAVRITLRGVKRRPCR